MYRSEFANWQAGNDHRLLDINAEIKRLRSRIEDKLWEGLDASGEQAALKDLKKSWQEGKQYYPRF